MITAQFSLYPLRTQDLGPALETALAALRATGMTADVGQISTLIAGTEAQVFSALRAAFTAAAERGDVVLVASVSNACAPTR